MSRASAKTLAFWLAADDQTDPVVGDAVAYVRTSGFNGTRPTTDVTAAGDSWQQHVGGIPGATINLSGVLDVTDPSGKFQLEDAFSDGAPRKFAIRPVAGSPALGITGTAFVTSLQDQGSYADTWTFNATLQVTDTITFEHGGP